MALIREISEDEYYLKLERAHNPPESGLNRADFDVEYYRLYDELEPILERYGENNAYGQGDYYLEPHIVDSRGLGFEVTNPEMVSLSLVNELSELVGRVDPRWEIYIRSDTFDFGIFISSPEVLLWKSEGAVIQLQA